MKTYSDTVVKVYNVSPEVYSSKIATSGELAEIAKANRRRVIPD